MKKILLLGFGAVVILLVIAVGVSSLQQHSAKSGAQLVSDTFVNDVLAGKDSESYNLFSDSAQQSTSSDDWQTEVTKLSTFFSGKKPTFQNITTTKTFQSATYSISGSDGDYTLSVILVRNNKSWQVQSFNSQLKS